MSYNRYRKRSYNISRSKSKEYAQELENLSITFDGLAQQGWDISTMMDSCYKVYGSFKLRLSNHSANNRYHDLENGNLIINVKKSKLEFVGFIENDLNDLLKQINELDLTKYRFINIVNNRISCFLKGYKTKKDVVIWNK